jgi:hypothetical protein
MRLFERRVLLFGSGGAIAGVILLDGCAAPAQTNAGLAVATAIGSGLIAIVADANTLAPSLVSTSAANTATDYLELGLTGAEDLLGLKTPPAGASTWTVIDTYFEDGLDLVAPIMTAMVPGSGAIIDAIEAAETLMVGFEGAITPSPTAAIARRQARLLKRPAPRAAMASDVALATLKAYVARPRLIRK